jgi:hypothetical protein
VPSLKQELADLLKTAGCLGFLLLVVNSIVIGAVILALNLVN